MSRRTWSKPPARKKRQRWRLEFMVSAFKAGERFHAGRRQSLMMPLLRVESLQWRPVPADWVFAGLCVFPVHLGICWSTRPSEAVSAVPDWFACSVIWPVLKAKIPGGTWPSASAGGWTPSVLFGWTARCSRFRPMPGKGRRVVGLCGAFAGGQMGAGPAAHAPGSDARLWRGGLEIWRLCLARASRLWPILPALP